MARHEHARDQIIASDLRELFVHDDRLSGCAVRTQVHGGVAHLVGTVPSSEHRDLVRSLTGRVRGIHAVWDVLRAPGEPVPLAIDIGCGGSKQRKDALGLDRLPLPGVDVLADLECGLPLRTSSVDLVFAIHVLEHVHRLVPLMDDIHRVLKPAGVLHVMVPNWRFVNAVADPTHVRFFDVQTFKAFCRPGLGRLFRPLSVSGTLDTIFADLQPIKCSDGVFVEQALARFFE
jgi:SAM-dependent methyltransferase